MRFRRVEIHVALNLNIPGQNQGNAGSKGQLILITTRSGCKFRRREKASRPQLMVIVHAAAAGVVNVPTHLNHPGFQNGWQNRQGISAELIVALAKCQWL